MKPISRKEQIIQTAFNLSSFNDDWSLSEIATTIGVSKTALYRHFKNKKELLDTMDSIIIDSLTEVIDKAGSTPESIRISLTQFFRNHNGILYTLIHNFFMRPGYDKFLLTQLVEKSIIVKKINTIVTNSVHREALAVVLIKNSVSILISGDTFFPKRNQNNRTYKDELLTILGQGFPQLTLPSMDRLEELCILCAIDKKELGPTNRLFDAIAFTIRKYGIKKTTIKRIADYMGIAKSSLYFYFPNKEEMLLELVQNEIENMTTLCSNRIKLGFNLAERLFILMITQTYYLIQKPDIIAVFNWIRYELVKNSSSFVGVSNKKQSIQENWNFEELFGNVPDIEERSKAILNWVSILSTSTVLHSFLNELDSKKIIEHIRYMFFSILLGDSYIGDLV